MKINFNFIKHALFIFIIISTSACKPDLMNKEVVEQSSKKSYMLNKQIYPKVVVEFKRLQAVEPSKESASLDVEFVMNSNGEVKEAKITSSDLTESSNKKFIRTFKKWIFRIDTAERNIDYFYSQAKFILTDDESILEKFYSECDKKQLSCFTLG